MPVDDMRDRVAKTIGRRGFTPALITAAGVFAALLVYSAIQAILSSISATAFAFDPAVPGFLGTIWSAQLLGSLTSSLPFAVGVFLALWQVAPIGPELRLGHVVTRSLLAALAGTACVIIVVVVLSVVGSIAGAGASWFGASFPDLGSALDGLWFTILNGVLSAIQALVEYAATVVLAGVLLWGWLQRHPPEHHVGGSLDEV